jgi:hypothetical protein
MTKILHSITVLIIASLAWILASCCSDGKNCEAGNTSLGTFPYAYGETLVFADSLDNRIYVKLANEPNGSTAYDLEGSCSTPRKELHCESSISLNRETVTDSAGLLGVNQRFFYCSISKGEGMPTSYALGAFGEAYFYINDYGSSNNIPYATPLPSYSTPHHTYTNVYINTNSVIPYQGKRVVFTPSGRLISFTMGQDSTHFFYAVE